MLTIVDETNINYEYDIRLNLVGKRKGIYLIQFTDGSDENQAESTYSVEVKAMYRPDSFDETNGKFRHNNNFTHFTPIIKKKKVEYY